jgi:hypothetical protein
MFSLQQNRRRRTGFAWKHGGREEVVGRWHKQCIHMKVNVKNDKIKREKKVLAIY